MCRNKIKKTIIIFVILSSVSILLQSTTAQVIYNISENGLVQKSSQNDVNSSYDLLIITPKEFIKSLRPLVVHKNKMGVKTKSVTLSQIKNMMFLPGRDDAEKIKYFIKAAHENWSIKYVLLVGGIKNQLSKDERWWLPVRYSYLVDRWDVMIPDRYNQIEKKFLSDLYFADIYDANGDFCSWDTDGDGFFGEWFDNNSAEDILDLHPDVYVGRLPCRNRFEVKVMVNKIINYELPSCKDSWFGKMLVVAGDTYIGDDDFEGEVDTQNALDQMPDFEHIKLWTSDGSFTSEIDVIQTISNGCGFLYLACHGSPSNIAAHPPNDSALILGLHVRHMPLLLNGRKLPICVTLGCHNSMFSVSLSHNAWRPSYNPRISECFSWHLTRKIWGGSIATIGPTAISLIAEDKLDPSKGGGIADLNTLFFEECGQNNTDILGDAWGNAIHNFLLDHPINWDENSYNDTSIDAKMVENWLLIGDPSLKIGGY